MCLLFFIFPQNDSPKIILKNVIFSSKKLFSFSRYSNMCISLVRPFFPVGHCFTVWLKINLKVYVAINRPNKNLIVHFVWYLDKEKSYGIEILSFDRLLNKEHFYGQKHKENVHQKLFPDPYLIFLSNPKRSFIKRPTSGTSSDNEW